MPTCTRCGTELSATARFCTECGTPTGPTDVDATDLAIPVLDQTRVIDVDLVSCPRCGASNAARRTRCGRCQAVLRPDVTNDGEPLEDDTRTQVTPMTVTTRRPATSPPAASPATTSSSRRRRAVATGIVLLGLLVGGGVGSAMALGVGPFATPEPVPFDGEAYTDEAEQLRVDRAGASTARGGQGDETHGHARSLDGDLGTAWVPGAQDAEPRLLHLFDAPVWVARIQIGTGWQADPATFRATGRVTRARIDLGTVVVDATIADEQGIQVLRLPDPVLVDQVTWQVTESVGGAGGIAEVRYIGWPAHAEDAETFRSR